VLDSKDKNAKLSQQVKHIQELIEKIEPEDGRNVFVYENIKVASAIENLNMIATKGKRVKYLYVHLSEVSDKSL
jgi:hypothetical protein